MQQKISPIFSLADPFSHTVTEVDTFEDLGEAHDGRHIGLFFRRIVDTELHVDYKNPFVLNRFCKMYNFVNTRGSIYGHLFAVSDPTKMELHPNRLTVSCRRIDRYDFTQLPINSDKQKLLIFKSNSGGILAVSKYRESPYLVVEPE